MPNYSKSRMPEYDYDYSQKRRVKKNENYMGGDKEYVYNQMEDPMEEKSMGNALEIIIGTAGREDMKRIPNYSKYNSSMNDEDDYEMSEDEEMRSPRRRSMDSDYEGGMKRKKRMGYPKGI